MIICERCSTQNLDGSRYCDECGAALWLAGRPGSGQARARANGDSGSRRDVPVTVARVANAAGAPVAAQQPQGAAPIAVPNAQIHATLIIERGNSAGKTFPLGEQDANIGRWDADGGVFPDVDLDSEDPEAKVSRRHARITFRNGQYTIEDLGSTNGTFVNRGRRLRKGDLHPLADGDEIIVGKTFLRFRLAK